MLTFLGGTAEFARDSKRARIGGGRERAKARGVHMGRPLPSCSISARESFTRPCQGQGDAGRLGAAVQRVAEYDFEGRALTEKDKLDSAFDAHRQELIEAAGMLLAVQQVFGGKVREQTKAAYKRLLDAHLLVTGVLGAALLRINGAVSPTNRNLEERNALFAAFVIGAGTCEGAIEEGRYLQASCLLRQEMELLTQLKAVRTGKRNEKTSPNLAALKDNDLGVSLARLYHELSTAAHVSKHHIVRSATEVEISGDDLPGPTNGTRYYPEFDEGLARRLFSLHLMLTIGIIEEFSIDLPEKSEDEGFSSRETEAVNLALALIKAEGMIDDYAPWRFVATASRPISIAGSTG